MTGFETEGPVEPFRAWGGLEHNGRNLAIGVPAQQLLHELPGEPAGTPLGRDHHRLHPAREAVEVGGRRRPRIDDAGGAANHLAGLAVLGDEYLHVVVRAERAAQPAAVGGAPARLLRRCAGRIAGVRAVEQMRAQLDQHGHVGRRGASHIDQRATHQATSVANAADARGMAKCSKVSRRAMARCSIWTRLWLGVALTRKRSVPTGTEG